MGLLDKVTKSAPPLPSRIYFYAQEKFGKSSFGCHAPNPIFVMTEGETGLLSLIEAGRVPETAHFPDDAKSWPQFMDMVHAVRNEQHDHRTLVIDTANGAERLLVKHVTDTEYNGVTSGRDGFASYGKGFESCIPHWVQFLSLLNEIRISRKMAILLLAHAKIKPVNNPEGSDYDQFRPDGVDKLWPLTHKWADVIAAGTYDLFVKDDKVKTGKGRVIRTSGSNAVVCGNRYGLPETIPCGADAKSAFENFAQALGRAKSAGAKKNPPPAATTPPQTPPPTSQQPPPDTVKPDLTPEEEAALQQGQNLEANLQGTAPATPPAASAPVTPQPSGKITKEQANQLLAAVHKCDTTWQDFRDTVMGYAGDRLPIDLLEVEYVSAMAELREIYKAKHPVKAKKEAAAQNGQAAHA